MARAISCNFSFFNLSIPSQSGRVKYSKHTAIVAIMPRWRIKTTSLDSLINSPANTHAMHTKNSVAKLCESVQIRLQITPFVLLPSFKINVLPTGSPTLFGVKKPEVRPIKTDLMASKIEIF